MTIDFVKSFEKLGLQLLRVTLLIPDHHKVCNMTKAAAMIQISLDYNKWSSIEYFDYVA